MSTKFGSFNPRPSPSFKKSSKLPTADINTCLKSVHVPAQTLKTHTMYLRCISESVVPYCPHPLQEVFVIQQLPTTGNNLTAECSGDRRFVICLFTWTLYHQQEWQLEDKYRTGGLDDHHKHFDIHTISQWVGFLKTHSPLKLNGLT